MLKLPLSRLKPLTRKERVPRADALAEWTGLTGIEAAKRYCIAEIRFYEDTSAVNFHRWRYWQVRAVVFGVIGTISAAVTLPPDWFPALNGFGWLRALPVAMASLASALLASFSYQSEFTRQGTTADALRGELALLIAGAEPYGAGGEVDKQVFMKNIRSIIATEHGRWSDETRTRLVESKKP